jgi:hypothetical protein
MEEEVITEELLQKAVDEFMSKGLMSINPLTIKNSYPKSFKKYEEIINNTIGILDNGDDTIMASLLYSPRSILYNLFDENSIYISVVTDFGQNWNFTLQYSLKELTSNGYISRIEAEKEGIMRAFKILEDLL